MKKFKICHEISLIVFTNVEKLYFLGKKAWELTDAKVYEGQSWHKSESCPTALWDQIL